MAWVATAIVVAVTAGQAVAAKKSADMARTDAKQDAKRARKNAREAAAFAETEGKALGDLGVVDLTVDDNLDESQRLRKKGRVNSTLSI